MKEVKTLGLGKKKGFTEGKSPAIARLFFSNKNGFPFFFYTKDRKKAPVSGNRLSPLSVLSDGRRQPARSFA